MYLNKQTLVHYQDVFQKIKEDGNSSTVNNRTEVEAFLKLLDGALDHIKKDNLLRKMVSELYDEYGGDHAGSIFNIATTRGSSLLLVESWFFDLKIIEKQFEKIHTSVLNFQTLNEQTPEFKIQNETIILLCTNLSKESSLLSNRMKKFFSEEHYQHNLFDKKDPDEFELNLLSWLS